MSRKVLVRLSQLSVVLWLVFLTGVSFTSYGQLIKVATYNIRYDNPDDGDDRWLLRKEDMANKVDSVNADIICFQEALSHQHDYLKSSLSHYASYAVGREDGILKGEMIPVFYDSTRFELMVAETKWLSESPDKPSKGWDAACERVVAVVQLKEIVSGKKLVVINTHWDHEGKVARFESARIVYDLAGIYRDQDVTVVLAGDLNLTPDDPLYKKVESELQSTCPYDQLQIATYNGFLKEHSQQSHIDYIFCSINCIVHSFEILNLLTGKGRRLSDHEMLVTEIRF
jgi:endonuclease/exonuclease/phosphatase family metal-dependent hydrolase